MSTFPITLHSAQGWVEGGRRGETPSDKYAFFSLCCQRSHYAAPLPRRNSKSGNACFMGGSGLVCTQVYFSKLETGVSKKKKEGDKNPLG